MAGELWQEHGLVFASRVGTPLSANNVIRAFRIITRKAGLGDDFSMPQPKPTLGLRHHLYRAPRLGLNWVPMTALGRSRRFRLT